MPFAPRNGVVKNDWSGNGRPSSSLARQTMTENGPTERDYYQILGVLQSATPADITAAYHLLARQCHPDAGGTDPGSLARFKLINEAYQVLSDDQRRRDYDRRPRSIPVVNSRDADLQPARRRATPQKPQDIEVELPVAPEEARHGGLCEFYLSVSDPCSHCRHKTVGDPPCVFCRGKGSICRRHRLQILLPSRLQSGTVLRVAGQGRRSETAAGDLLLRITIQPSW